MWNGSHAPDHSDDTTAVGAVVDTHHLAVSALAAYQEYAGAASAPGPQEYTDTAVARRPTNGEDDDYSRTLAAGYPTAYPEGDAEDDEDDDDEEDDEEDDEYANLSSREEYLAAESGHRGPHHYGNGRSGNYDDEDEDEEDVVAMAVPSSASRPSQRDPVASAVSSAPTDIDKDEGDDDVEAVAVVESHKVEADVVVSVPTPTSAASSKKSKSSSSRKKSTKSSRKKTSIPTPTLDDPVPAITEVEYENIEALMVQFCKVPLLAEFSRPVSVLHPELFPLYSKIVKHPIDLGQVCRSIRRRSYKNLRSIRLDMWRIFANCIKYHSNPSNKDGAVPAFISMALHLREYFNALWEEYVLPSDPPKPLTNSRPSREQTLERDKFTKRDENREKRSRAIGMTMLSGGFLKKAVETVETFFQQHGRIDQLDDTILDKDNDNFDMQTVLSNLRRLLVDLRAIAAEEREYVVDDFVRDVKRCYSYPELFENEPHLRIKLSHRMHRLIERLLVPIYEASCRGVNQSSIWGCMAAVIWARESSKKPYWPALVLGILAPEEQKEDWHFALTERNEARLPDRLRAELMNGKKKAEQALKRQKTAGAEQMSYFLVEFMGTHEFIWVKEADIIENFDPTADPNMVSVGGNVTKKKRSRATDSKTFQAALEEGRWAVEEFELQLSDTCGDLADEEDDEDGYSYVNLSQSDEEVEEDEGAKKKMSDSDIEEANELLATCGLFDFSEEGQKNAKKREKQRRKQKADAEKAAAKKEREEKAKRAKEEKNQKRKQARDLKKQKEAEAKALKAAAKAKTSSTTASPKPPPKKKRLESKSAEASKAKRQRKHKIVKPPPNRDKQERASAIVKGFVTRIAEQDDMRTLMLNGVINVPASVVDSTGLLGMALAFRAAAGEIAMPDNGDEDEEMKQAIRPWEGVDLSKIASAADREKKLDDQVEALKRRIAQVTENTKKRRKLLQQTVAKKKQTETEIFAAEAKAKRIIMRTKRKASTKPAPKKSGPVAKEVVSNVKVVAAAHDDSDGMVADEAVVSVPVEADDDDGDDEVTATVEVDDDPDAVAVEAVVDVE